MSNLTAFLHPVQGDETKEVVISKRFVGEDGKPVPFRIRPVTQEENDAITKSCMRQAKVKGQLVERLDSVKYSRMLVVAATEEPNFRSPEMVEAYGVVDPLNVPGKMLLAGEYGRLSKEIMLLSGFETDGLEDDAKN